MAGSFGDMAREMEKVPEGKVSEEKVSEGEGFVVESHLGLGRDVLLSEPISTNPLITPL